MHIGIIPDGNRRWCKNNNMKLNNIIEKWMNLITNNIEIILDAINNKWNAQLQNLSFIDEVSIYLFTIDNLGREDDTMHSIYKFIERVDSLKSTLKESIIQAISRYVNLNIVGHTACLPQNIQDIINNAEKTLNGKYTLTIGLAYDPKKDIHNIIMNKCKRNQSDIDLVIRSGGEYRSSGFFPYHTMYSEYVFLDKLWPDIQLSDISDAIETYKKRQRRFGK